MKANKSLTLIVITIMAILTVGCDSKPEQVTAEVNDENCKPENIARLKGKAAQQAFSSLCLRRGGTSKPSQYKEW
ncbi:MAG TPA: entry exclusion lipoprotein TrbK [Anaerolineae bacterium]|nr:entry exclusion lipoprotein TrbK [Anaerolineae bacterium]